MNWNDLTVLVTGGTGSFGHKFTEILLREYRPKKLIVFSRDELKQHEMRQLWDDRPDDARIRYFVGDIRDRDRLYRANSATRASPSWRTCGPWSFPTTGPATCGSWPTPLPTRTSRFRRLTRQGTRMRRRAVSRALGIGLTFTGFPFFLS